VRRTLACALVAAATLAPGAQAALPTSLAVLGDAGANGWTIASDPAVESLSTRLDALGVHVRIRTATKEGALAADLLLQLRAILAPKPDLVVIQVGENDICAGDDTPLPTFRLELARALTVLTHALPNARLLVVSIPLSSQRLQALVGNPDAEAVWSTGGECDPHWDADGNPDPQRLASIDRLVQRYDAVLQSTCALFLHCGYDRGTAATLAAAPDDFTSLAAAEWTALGAYADTTPPVSSATVRAVRGTRVVTLTARDDTSLAGIEYVLGRNGTWRRYRAPIHLPPRTILTWRAVDTSGNVEPTHRLL
jgi:hypothetical protein